MNVILLDDEPLALAYLEHQLRSFDGIEVAESFEEPSELIEWVRSPDREVEALFLDIQMPGTNGIELAERLLEIRPKLQIVFVTAYDEYAVQAFELHAIDYLLKPVSAERLAKSVQRLKETALERAAASAAASVALADAADAADATEGGGDIRLQLFQQFMVEGADGALAPIRWRTTKAQELFLYLLQHRGKLVRKSALIDLLWPDAEADKALSQLYTSVYHIRKAIAPYGARFRLTNTPEGYTLGTRSVRLDVELWERAVVTAERIDASTIQDVEAAMRLYGGDYLQEFDYWWAESERQRLRLLWLRASFAMAEWYAASGQPMKALDKYLEIVGRQPQAEEAQFALMKIYADMNQHASVHHRYRELETVLLEEMNEPPSAYITEWYTKWAEEQGE